MPGRLRERQAQETGGREGSQGLHTHSMGFPLISDMMELSSEVFIAQAQEIIDDQGCENKVQRNHSDQQNG